MKKNILKQVAQFFEKDIWKISTKDKHPIFNFFVKQGKTLYLAYKGFSRDKIQLRSSALSFYTLLSIVPILALIFGIAGGFGLQDKLATLLTERLQGQQEILKTLLGFVDRYLGHINTGYIAGIGIIILFWSVMQVFGNIESSFNNIWQVKKSRVITRQFTDYISLMIIAPLFLIISSSFNVSQLAVISEKLPFLHYLDSILKVLVTILSYTLIWFVFTLIYIVVPNTKVRFIPALSAGILAGTLFQLLQWGYVNFQSLLSGYGAIYGTFAALPLFMIWLEWSWLIVLFGAEVSYAYQNTVHYEQEIEEIKVSHSHRRVLELMIMHKVVKNFTMGQAPMNDTTIAAELNIPARLVREIIYDLLNARIICETLTPEIREVAYQPAIDPAKITISYVLDALEKQGQQIPFEKESVELQKFSQVIESFYEDIRNSSNNTLLKEI